jgi:hypothetical protein
MKKELNVVRSQAYCLPCDAAPKSIIGINYSQHGRSRGTATLGLASYSIQVNNWKAHPNPIYSLLDLFGVLLNNARQRRHKRFAKINSCACHQLELCYFFCVGSNCASVLCYCNHETLWSRLLRWEGKCFGVICCLHLQGRHMTIERTVLPKRNY